MKKIHNFVYVVKIIFYLNIQLCIIFNRNWIKVQITDCNIHHTFIHIYIHILMKKYYKLIIDGVKMYLQMKSIIR